VINATLGLGCHWLAPMVDEFAKQFPKIDLVLIFSPQAKMDVAMREADLSIRLEAPQETDLIRARLMSYQHAIYTSEDYVAKNGIPKTINELEKHSIITFGNHTGATHPYPEIDWLLTYQRPEQKKLIPTIQINSVSAILQAVIHGAGIASLPKYMVEQQPQLVEILPEIKAPLTDVWIAYPEELRTSKRIKLFNEFIRSKARLLVKKNLAII
ncbi:MAG: substrate binding domain-containing protein, partial [Pseudomonadota bacterium]